MGRLDGKVAIITGGASGMGRATSLLWAKEGAKVVVVDLDSSGGEMTVSEIKATSGDAIFVKADVSKAGDARNMVKAAVDTYGRLNLLFNNAGILGPRGMTVVHMPEEEADHLIAVNFKGVFLGTKYAIPEMQKTGGGSIISTASECGVHACAGLAVYAGTKGAVISFTRAVAIECSRLGIRVNCISPCATATPMHKETMKTALWKELERQIPLGRVCQPEDIANAALFLASDEAGFITGHNLVVDGGFTIRGVS